MLKRTEKRGIRPPAPVSDMTAPLDVSPCPMVYPIAVGWGDCDPAQIAYTARIPEWGLKALEGWYKTCLGVNWFEINLDHGIGTPFVNLAFDFTHPVTPRAVLACTVFVSRIGRSSVSHVVEGRQSGVLCFTGRATSAFVDAHAMVPIAIPPNMRESMTRYEARQGAVPADAGRARP